MLLAACLVPPPGFLTHHNGTGVSHGCALHFGGLWFNVSGHTSISIYAELHRVCENIQAVVLIIIFEVKVLKQKQVQVVRTGT